MERDLQIEKGNEFLHRLYPNADQMLKTAYLRGYVSKDDYGLLLGAAFKAWQLSSKNKKLKKSAKEKKNLKIISDELMKNIYDTIQLLKTTVNEQIVLSFLLDIIINISEYFNMISAHKLTMTREAIKGGLGYKSLQCMEDTEELALKMLLKAIEEERKNEDPVLPEAVYKSLSSSCDILNRVVINNEFFLSYIDRLVLQKDCMNLCDGKNKKFVLDGKFYGVDFEDFKAKRLSEKALDKEYEFLSVMYNRIDIVHDYIEKTGFTKADKSEVKRALDYVEKGLWHYKKLLFQEEV